jgi:hypothetical protein
MTLDSLSKPKDWDMAWWIGTRPDGVSVGRMILGCFSMGCFPPLDGLSGLSPVFMVRQELRRVEAGVLTPLAGCSLKDGGDPRSGEESRWL